MAGLIPVPDKAWGSFIHHQQDDVSEMDQELLEELRVVLENELIREKLSEFGLSSEEIIHRIEQLSPEEKQIVLDELQTVQAGGQWEGLFIILVAIYVIGTIVMLISVFISLGKGIIGLPKALSKQNDAREKSVSFGRATDTDFPPYKGRVKVLIKEEPEENFIYIGQVSIRDVVAGANKEKRKKRLLHLMKKEAAKYGADTIILSTSVPDKDLRNYLHWSAQAYRTQEEVENTN